MDPLSTGVIFTPLKRISNPKGDIYHCIKKSDPTFYGFGEAYFTAISYLEVKGWKRHSIMTLNLTVITGSVKFYIYDEPSKQTSKYELGVENYGRITIPPMYWVAMQGLNQETNLVLNVADIEHAQEESESVSLETYPL